MHDVFSEEAIYIGNIRAFIGLSLQRSLLAEDES